jgi:hypothetical protein
MTTAALTALPAQSRPALILGAGAMLGLAYTLSPLSVLSLALLAWALASGARGLSAGERRWYWSILTISVAIRLTVIALLFLTADRSHPFASFFGDEELYKFRTIWLRNIGQGIPMSPADVIYSYDGVGHTSYIFVLAFVQALVGDAPYGLHVLNMVLMLCGILALYRVVRASYGGIVAMGGLIALLCLPTLVLWSISVLKEPLTAFMIVVELISALMIVRAPRWWQRALAAVLVIGAGLAMESFRTGGALTAVLGTIGGLGAAFVLARGRRVVVAVAAVLLVASVAVGIVAKSAPVQESLLTQVRNLAWYHAGHVVTPGYSYLLVAPGYYGDRWKLHMMPAVDAGRFVVKALWSYMTEPVPWRMESRTLLAFLPEQIVWYVLALLIPIGLYAGLKRDVLLTCLLASHAAVSIAIVAVASGNIGTLIRHRSLVLPYIVWISAVGAHDCVRLLVSRRAAAWQRSRDGDR